MADQTIQQIRVEQIIAGKQIRERFDEESFLGLAQSLRESGQHEPVHVRPLENGKYQLITGERRLRAARKAGWTSLSAIVEEGELPKEQLLIRQLIENWQREDLTAIEKARGLVAVMKETGWTASQTASKLGLANGTVTKLLALLSLPQSLQDQIHNGAVPATAAYELAKVPDEAQRAELASRIAKGELTRDGLTAAVRAGKTKQRQRTRLARYTAKLQERQSITVTAPKLDLPAFLALLQSLAARASQAQGEGLSLDLFLKRLQNERGSATPTQGV